MVSKVPHLSRLDLQIARGFANKKYAASHEVLGSGHFSEVYVHPTRQDCVVKVSTQSNDGGVLYAFWARAHQHLKGVPQVLDIYQTEGSGKIDPNSGLRQSTITVITLKRYGDVVKANQYHHVDSLGMTAVAAQQSLHRILWGSDPQETSLGLSQEGLEYGNTILAIRKFFRGVSDYDLHDENVMIDYDSGDLIIIDPLSFNRCGDANAVIRHIEGAGSEIRGTSYNLVIMDDLVVNPTRSGDSTAVQHIPGNARLGEVSPAGGAVGDFSWVDRPPNLGQLRRLQDSGEGVQQAVSSSLRSLAL